MLYMYYYAKGCVGSTKVKVSRPLRLCDLIKEFLILPTTLAMYWVVCTTMVGIMWPATNVKTTHAMKHVHSCTALLQWRMLCIVHVLFAKDAHMHCSYTIICAICKNAHMPCIHIVKWVAMTHSPMLTWSVDHSIMQVMFPRHSLT